ncbi:hypothetical protein B0H19DRAFT_1365112 [Mycena capillaripes]|nr:hypothetical protein B0H19DRAFT_1365112 [Mycena capillaripes]
MASKHTPDDQKLIDSLSMGVMTAFRSSIYQQGFIVGNPHLFINNDWIDVVQLRAFLENTTIHPDNSALARVKVEYDASDASVSRPSVIPDVRVRVLTEGTQEVLEILSDSEDTVGSPDTRQSSPLPPSDIPSDSTLDTAADDRQSTPSDMRSDFASHGDSESDTAADLDGYFSSDELEVVPGLQKSDTAWLDEELTSRVRIGEFQVTAEVTVEHVEYLTELPSLYPIPETPTAFVIDLQDPKFNITKNGAMYTVDALIKNKDNDSWKGNTRTGDSHVLVSFEPGAEPILCRRSRLNCKGAYVCERVDPRLLKVVRRDLEPASRDAVFAAQRQTRRDEGTTAERKVTQFIQLIRGQKCGATDKHGVKCQGVPILRTKKQISRGHKFWVGCSGFESSSTGRHNSWSIPDDVDGPMFVKGLSGAPLVAGDSKDTAPCSAILHPTTGLKQRHCHKLLFLFPQPCILNDNWLAAHDHIINGSGVTSSIVNRPCEARRTIYVPVDTNIRKALIIPPRNIAHNHPMPSLKKVSLELKESYRKCIKASGCVGATVAKVDNAPSTQLLLNGRKPAEFAPALQSNKVKRKLVREVKMEAYPAGLGPAGAFKLFFDELQKPVDERYIQRLVTMPDGGIMILTCLAALMKLLDDTGVTSFETDTTFKRVEGDINDAASIAFFARLFDRTEFTDSAVTIARAYVNGASTEFYERLYDEFQSVKMDLTGKPVAFKRFVKGGNLLAMNSDMEGAQVLGAAHSFFKTNVPEYSGLSSDTPAEEVAPQIIKLCTTHAKRAVLDFRGLVSEQDYHRLMDFTYIDSEETLEEFSEYVRGLGVKKIQDWWNHKAMSAWILPCLIKSQSPMSAEDWDNTPATTNTGEAQHHWTNSRTGTKLSLVEAIETARKVDEGVAREIEISLKSGVLVNPRNDLSHRLARNTTRASTTMRKSRESRELADEQALLQMEIEAEKEARKASAARLKALQVRKSAARKNMPAAKRRGARTVVVGSSSSGRVTTRTIVSTPLRSTNDAEPPSLPMASTSATLLLADGAVTSAAPLSSFNWQNPDTQGTAYTCGVEGNQQFGNFNFDFLTPDPWNYGNIGDDLTWLNSLIFDNTPSAPNPNYDSSTGKPTPDDMVQSSPSNSLPRLPPIPPSPSSASMSPAFDALAMEPIATTSKKRKTRDEVDPSNMVEGTRARKAPKRFDI